jgi:hypothetical protein
MSLNLSTDITLRFFERPFERVYRNNLFLYTLWIAYKNNLNLYESGLYYIFCYKNSLYIKRKVFIF